MIIGSKPYPIVETSVTSENNGIPVGQTVQTLASHLPAFNAYTAGELEHARLILHETIISPSLLDRQRCTYKT